MPPGRPRAAPRACRPCTTGRAGRARCGSTANARVAGDRQLDHREPVRAGRDPARPGLCGGAPAGTNRTRSRPEGLARLLGDRQVAVVDRVERAAEDPERAGHDRRAARRVTSRSQGCASHSSSVAADPDRVARRDARPGAARRRCPSRARSRWKRSADSSIVEVGLGGDPLDPLAADAEGAVGSRSTLKPSPIASIRWTTTPAGSGGVVELVGVGQQLGERAPRSSARPSPRRRGDGDDVDALASRGAARNAGQASAAAGRSILLNATSIGLLEERRIVGARARRG